MMPRKPLPGCRKAGCPGKIDKGNCSHCGQSRRVDNRISAARRGYGRRWQRLRLMQLARHPLCKHCQDAGIITAATEVDHILARRAGGSDAMANLQSLCKSCHSKKTAAEAGGEGGSDS